MFYYHPPAALLQALGFVAFASPPQQQRYSRPSSCGHETIVLYEDRELALLEVVNGQLLYNFQGRVASEAELLTLFRQVNWAADVSSSD